MMRIEDFDVSPEVIGIFNDRMILLLEDIVYALEMYKFKTRNEIIEILNKQVFILEELNNHFHLDKNKMFIQSIDNVNRNERYKELEEKYNVIISQITSDTVLVISAFTKKYNVSAVDIALDSKYIRYAVVTPYNYSVLNNEIIKYNASIVFKRLVLECIWRKGTDLHLSVEHVDKKPCYTSKYRRDGYLCDLNLFPLTKELNENMVKCAVENMSNRDAIDLTIASGVATTIPDVFADGSVELRLAAHHVLDGYDCVCRIQRTSTVSMTIEQLGFPLDVQMVLHKIAKKRSGITLITGPIRTGKNTTAFAIAHKMATYPVMIKSIESPIEVLMPFPQVDYKDDITALEKSVRLAKKQDLDVVLINEIPESGVAFAVKDLVNSSVHVLTTLHIDRLWHLPYKLHEYFHDDYKDIISQINVVINQKMFGVLCTNCVHDALVDDLDQEYAEFLKKFNVTVVGEPAGCACCTDHETGLKGTVLGQNQPYVEYVVFNDYVKNSLLSCKYPHEMEEFLKKYLFDNRRSLEFVLSKAIADKKLHYSVLDSIL